MSLGEFDVIARFLKPLAKDAPGALGLVDDAAVLQVPPGRDLVLAKDAMVEGVHFLDSDPPETVAKKLLRVNLSDLAAMGAEPLACLTALVFPESFGDRQKEAFFAGLGEDLRGHGVQILGGDITGTPGPWTLSLTILGLVPRGCALLRSGARPGDHLWVSGTLGDAALALRIQRGLAASEDEAQTLLQRYRLPEPRLDLGIALRGIAHACIDLSDGLLADLGHVVEASGVGADLLVERLPLSTAGRNLPGAQLSALTGGDDYELLFCAPPERSAAIEAIGRELGLALSEIGHVTPEPGIRLKDAAGRILPSPERTGWRHF